MRDDPSSSLVRKSLWPFSFVYRLVTGARNVAFDRGMFGSQALAVPVVSVGNLTVGGTGKTPLVIWLVAAAKRAGKRPGVLARGYGKSEIERLNDEGMLLDARYPGLPQVQDPDRVAGGQRLVAEHGVDVVILDDGYQHRRLRRDCDIVCLDARYPFAQGSVLPSGDLREAARPGLQRASVVVLTRVDRLGDERLADARKDQIREYAGRPDLPIFACSHAPTGIASLNSPAEAIELASLRDRRVLLVSAIARPAAFRETVEPLGCEVVEELTFRDHHRYDGADAERIRDRASAHQATVLTTEKDAVKLRSLDVDALVLQIDLCWVGVGPRADEVGLA